MTEVEEARSNFREQCAQLRKLQHCIQSSSADLTGLSSQVPKLLGTMPGSPRSAAARDPNLVTESPLRMLLLCLRSLYVECEKKKHNKIKTTPPGRAVSIPRPSSPVNNSVPVAWRSLDLSNDGVPEAGHVVGADLPIPSTPAHISPIRQLLPPSSLRLGRALTGVTGAPLARGNSFTIKDITRIRPVTPSPSVHWTPKLSPERRLGLRGVSPAGSIRRGGSITTKKALELVRDFE